MIHRNCLEALDKIIQDLLSDSVLNPNRKPFRGKVVVFDEDFRQVLPVIPFGSKSDIINAAICNSSMWKDCELLTLTINMRLHWPDLDGISKLEMEQFGQWLLEVGDGTLWSLRNSDDEKGEWIAIPDDMAITDDGTL